MNENVLVDCLGSHSMRAMLDETSKVQPVFADMPITHVCLSLPACNPPLPILMYCLPKARLTFITLTSSNAAH